MKKLITIILAILMLANVVPVAHVQASVAAPPETWQEHWFEHDQLVKRVYYNDDVAVYFDDDINGSNAGWIYSFVTEVCQYTKQVYVPMGGDERLYVIIHNKYSGGHPAYCYDSSHDYRNVIDVGGSDFSSQSGWNIDVLIHEIGHIVESTTNGAKGSPAFGIWQDSKWCEIYQYDVYNGIGMTDEADRIYNSYMSAADSFPKSGTAWFKDWFYPIYSSCGKSQVLSKYFRLLSQYYPKDSDGYYTQDMNMGEFVHFMNGAAGADLKSLATNAFGWTTEYENQYQTACQDFPFIYGTTDGVTFYGDANYGGWSVTLGAGNYNYSEMVAAGIPNDKLSSLKVPAGFKVTLYENANFGGSQKAVTEDTSYLGDFNDLTSSIKVESEDLPVFYTDADYQGTSVKLSAGSYNYSDLIAKGLKNDSLSSVKVPEGYKITLYYDADYKGSAKVLLEDTSFLGTFNDKTSSIKVEKIPVGN